MPHSIERDIVPFRTGYRAAGLLLHITSLPSRFGIGDMGPEAFTWIDRLHEAGLSWWQSLPLGPTGYGDSPYQSLSSFVGNGLLISPEFLIEDGLLQPAECRGSFSSTAIDYQAVIPFKQRLLPIVWNRFRALAREDLVGEYEQFCAARADWLEDYTLFRAIRAKYNNAYYLDWPEDLVRRVPSALAQARRFLANEIDQIRLAQFLLYRQGRRLKDYARQKGVRLIGDLPFFVSPDSSDVWAHPELFLLDENRRPRFVAGVPPDFFSAHGQLWGNPVYDWDALADTGYSWWIERVRSALAQVDVIRLDHFRAFAAAWHVPAGATTAEMGGWVPGPGARLFQALHSELGELPFIAEDLGFITPDVTALRERHRIPSTRVLQFAFDGSSDNVHLPENYAPNTVAYTGTHDNATSREWFQHAPERERRCFWEYLRQPEGEIRDVARHLIRLAWASPAALAIAPFQDLLNLGSSGRMNVPGAAEGNWRWRATRHMLATRNFEWLGDLTKITKRVESTAMEVAS